MERQTISDTQVKELLVSGGGVIVKADQLERLIAERDALRAEVERLRAELAAAKEHSEYQDKECRLWAAVANIGTWPLSEEDTRNTGFFGRLAAKVTAERNAANARAEAAEAHAERLRAALKHAHLGINTLMSADISMALLAVPLEAKRMAIAALAETPAKSLAKVKAAALREAADKIKQDDGVIGQCSAYMALTLMVDELEAE